MYLKKINTVITGKRKAFKKERIPINFFTNKEQIGGNFKTRAPSGQAIKKRRLSCQ